MNQQLEFDTPGAPTQLAWRSAETVDPGPNDVRIRQTAIGVNYVDIYFRQGLYPMPKGETVPGVEAVGVIDAVGTRVKDYRIGDRVAYAGLPVGAYRQYRNIAAERLVKVPDSLPDTAIAGSLLRGMTAHLLLDVVGQLQPGKSVLIHAAAGGLGLILVQWAKRRGARTIGTVSTTDKAAMALKAGLDIPVLYRDTDFVEETLAATEGRGADLVIDGVGGDNLVRSIKATRAFGTVLNIGQTAGPVPPLDIQLLTNRSLMRPSVLAYLADPIAYRCAAKGWFSRLEAGLDVSGGHDYAFADAATAHADIESGRTSGAVRLIL